jgi:hypothetical protein
MSMGGTALRAGTVTSSRSATLPSALFVGRICGPVQIGVRTVWALQSCLRACSRPESYRRSRPDGAVRGFSFRRGVDVSTLFAFPPSPLGPAAKTLSPPPASGGTPAAGTPPPSPTVGA